jgi:2'-hydroxyisoflavone reductase
VRILVLGGTRFIGSTFVETALAHQHKLTLFNRGRSHPELFASVQRVTGDRGDPAAVSQLAAHEWDCIVDISGYSPDQVRPILDIPGHSSAHYVYISTVSVYAEPMPPDAAEDAPLLEVDESISAGDARAYGGLKALCESLLRDSVGDRLTVLRPTFVIGPDDYTDRFTWWVRRIARGGRMAVPRRLEQHLQLIDVRDLAGFALKVIEQRTLGTFNAVGPEQPLTVGTMVDSVQQALEVTVTPVPVGTGRRARSTFPLCIGDDDDGSLRVSGAAARAHGLSLRPLAESVRDIREWDRARGEPPLRAGPTTAEEDALLAART